MKNKREILESFYQGRFEKTINEKLLYYSYSFETALVYGYIDDILSIRLEDYITYLVDNYDVSFLESRDVMQFSSLDDFTVNMCNVIKEAGDKGFGYLDIGKLLENDGINRRDGAFTKYGENHAKSASEVGLLFSMSNKYFLSCLGYVFNDLPEDKRSKLLCRLFLRNKLIRRLIYRWKMTGFASYDDEAGFLSESTRKRRNSNIKKIVDYLRSSKEYNFTDFAEHCHF